jgi:hypothetical protein
MRLRAIPRLCAAAACSALLAVSGGPAFGAAGGADPATTVWEAGGSNMGECSAYLGERRVRDDVNRLIKDGAIPGVENPGQVYKVRAQQEESKPPEQECLRRH